MNSKDYWKKRAAQRMYGYHKLADDVADDIAKAYIKATNQINEEITAIFRTFKLEAGLSESEARKLLNNLPDNVKLYELKKIVGKVKDPVKKQELLNIINAPAYAWRIKRFQELQEDIDKQTKQLAEFEQGVTQAHYVDLANEAYNRTMFDIQKETGYGFSFAQMSLSRIAEILDNNWSGKLFSARIWGNTADLNNKIKQELLVGFMTGRSYRKTAAAVQKQCQVGAWEARRLVRTESTYIANMSELESYKESGIKKYRFLATLDIRTSDICRAMDGKVFLVEDGVPGTNIPPLHPWCRSTTVPAIDGMIRDGLKRRARDPVTGKTYLVPADMTYEEWQKSIDEKYAEGSWEIARKKVLNRVRDKEQYAQYKTTLGANNMPKSFDKFQDLKYNNIDSWKELKSDYRYKNLLNQRDVFVIDDSVRSLPIEGRANSIADLVDENGNVKQRRIYGPNKKTYKDFDTSDHKRPKYHPMGAHKHSFDYSKKNPHGKADYLTERELRQNADIIQEGVNYHDNRQKEAD